MKIDGLIDTHCHLGWKSLEKDLDAILAHAADAGILAMVDVGINVESSQRAVERSRLHEVLHATAGLHPCDSSDHVSDFPEIVQLAQLDEVVAIGETGLDLYWKDVPLATQRASLDKHLDLARQTGKPIILHCRDAFPELLQLLRYRAPLHGVLHCFTGDQAQAAECLRLGLHISYAGPLTYKKNEALRNIASETPSDRLLIETDAPFLPPQDKRGKRNEPAYMRYTFEQLARVRKAKAEELSALLLENSRHLFGLTGSP